MVKQVFFSFDTRQQVIGKEIQHKLQSQAGKASYLDEYQNSIEQKTISLSIFSKYISVARNLKLHLQTRILNITPDSFN